MLLTTPLDHAAACLRLAMTELLQTRRVLLAQALVQHLGRHVAGGSHALYPSWYRRGLDAPGVTVGQLLWPLRGLARHLAHACLYFEEAGFMCEAADACVEFGLRHGVVELMDWGVASRAAAVRVCGRCEGRSA